MKKILLTVSLLMAFAHTMPQGVHLPNESKLLIPAKEALINELLDSNTKFRNLNANVSMSFLSNENEVDSIQIYTYEKLSDQYLTIIETVMDSSKYYNDIFNDEATFKYDTLVINTMKRYFDNRIVKLMTNYNEYLEKIELLRDSISKRQNPKKMYIIIIEYNYDQFSEKRGVWLPVEDRTVYVLNEAYKIQPNK